MQRESSTLSDAGDSAGCRGQAHNLDNRVRLPGPLPPLDFTPIALACGHLIDRPEGVPLPDDFRALLGTGPTVSGPVFVHIDDGKRRSLVVCPRGCGLQEWIAEPQSG